MLEILFKKYFWIVHLLFITLAAYLLAGGINEGVLLYVTKKIEAQSSKTKSKRSYTGKSSNAYRNFSDASEQNIFEAKREKIVDFNGENGGIKACKSHSDCIHGEKCRKNPTKGEDVPEKICQMEEEISPKDVDCSAAPLSEAALRIVGVSVFENSEDSYASIIDENDGRKAQALVYAINKCSEAPEIPEDDVEHENNFLPKPFPCNELPGEHSLVQITWDGACLINSEENRYERLLLEEPEDAPKKKRISKKSGSSKPKKKKKKGRHSELMDEIAEGITKTGANSYSIKQDSINKAMGNLSRLSSQARIVPAFENGESVGFKLFSIRPNSIFSKIGLKNGDILQKVNGYEINNFEKAMGLFQKLRDGKDFSLDLKRHGSNKSMEYGIVP